MYERLTALIPALQSDFDDTKPWHLIAEIQRFGDEHEDFGLIHYQDILKLKEEVQTVDVSHLDGKAVMALLVYAYRYDR